MRVVHLVTVDNGGAFRAAERISNSLKSAGNQSDILVLLNTFGNGVVPFWNHEIFTKLYWKYTYLFGNNIQALEFYNNKKGVDVTRYELIKKADIVNIHWINCNFLSCTSLNKLIRKKPVVWTMHDTFAFTAGCCYPGECTQYQSKCSCCPKLEGIMDKENIRNFYREKEKCYKNNPFYLVGCSNWMAECASKSALCHDMPIFAIPNPIDLNVFRPMDKDEAKTALGLPLNKKVILFGADNGTVNPRKGYDLLIKALLSIPAEQYCLVVFGGDKTLNDIGNHQVISIGKIDDDKKLTTIYSASDVFVAPSREENLANTVMEALACGTPVVAFHIGGMPDLIVHEKTGYLATPFETEDLAKGIQVAANNSVVMGQHAFDYVKEHFSYTTVANQYLNVYQQCIDAFNSLKRV